MFDKEVRREKLLKLYPPEITSRADIHEKLFGEPESAESRPEKGWQSLPNSYLAEKVQKAETRNNKKISSVEVYLMPDSRSSLDFTSLCRLTFYYDIDEKVVDVEWDYASD